MEVKSACILSLVMLFWNTSIIKLEFTRKTAHLKEKINLPSIFVYVNYEMNSTSVEVFMVRKRTERIKFLGLEMK